MRSVSCSRLLCFLTCLLCSVNLGLCSGGRSYNITLFVPDRKWASSNADLWVRLENDGVYTSWFVLKSVTGGQQGLGLSWFRHLEDIGDPTDAILLFEKGSNDGMHLKDFWVDDVGIAGIAGNGRWMKGTSTKCAVLWINFVTSIASGGGYSNCPYTMSYDTPAPTNAITDPPSSSPSQFPTYPTPSPTFMPSGEPTGTPTTEDPTSSPSAIPSSDPTSDPSAAPSRTPTGEPTGFPSRTPSGVPSGSPSEAPSPEPSSQPSSQPSADPTGSPVSAPTAPSEDPTARPSNMPSVIPSAQPSNDPTLVPSDISAAPSGSPTSRPSNEPSGVPTSRPTGLPSSSPSAEPSGLPSRAPSLTPSSTPTTAEPTTQPTDEPTSSGVRSDSITAGAADADDAEVTLNWVIPLLCALAVFACFGAAAYWVRRDKMKEQEKKKRLAMEPNDSNAMQRVQSVEASVVSGTRGTRAGTIDLTARGAMSGRTTSIPDYGADDDFVTQTLRSVSMEDEGNFGTGDAKGASPSPRPDMAGYRGMSHTDAHEYNQQAKGLSRRNLFDHEDENAAGPEPMEVVSFQPDGLAKYENVLTQQWKSERNLKLGAVEDETTL